MRNFEKIIGEKYLTSNIENNEYSYLKTFNKEQIRKILGKKSDEKLHVFLDRRFYSDGVAVLVEKKQGQNIAKYEEQLRDYMKLEEAMNTKKIVAILYDIETNDFMCLTHQNESSFQTMEYYIGLFSKPVPKDEIYKKVQSINRRLHKLGMSNLISRMEFTGLSLAGIRFAIDESIPIATTSFEDMKSSILRILKSKIPTGSPHKDSKLYLLAEEYEKISLNDTSEQDVKDIYDDIYSISEWINSYSWDGKDAMAIFFNEFRRYAGKREHGQVFTPEIWTELIYKLLDVQYTDNVLDAACGSGTFLTKSMSKMIGQKPENKSQICNQIFGVEWARELYVLACVNMLMHKDGKSNIIQGDSTTEATGKWIKSLNISKVLMNPPFEKQTGIKIVKNVLDNVLPNSLCAFILPDRTLYTKSQKIVKSILSKHTLLKIIKMPEKAWQGIAGVTTSIFIFRTDIPHKNKDIIKYWIQDDELVTVKNSGRQDLHNRWIDDGKDNLLKMWVNIISNNLDHETKQVSKTLEYDIPKEMPILSTECFKKSIINRLAFENGEVNNQILTIKQLLSSLDDFDWLVWALKEND